MERSIRNNTSKLCAICPKQSARNARICGRTKIFGQKQHNVAAATIFSRFASCDFFLFPKLKRQKSKTSQNTLKQNSSQKLTEEFFVYRYVLLHIFIVNLCCFTASARFYHLILRLSQEKNHRTQKSGWMYKIGFHSVALCVLE